MDQVNSFAMFKEYWDLITLLAPEEQSNVLKAICEYMFEDKKPKLTERENKVFINLKRPLDKSKKRSKCGSITTTKQNQNEIKMKSNKNQNNNKTKTHQDVIVSVYDNVYVYVESKIGRTLNSSEITLIETWDIYKPYQIEYAINETLLARAKSLKYTDAILKNIKDKTEEELKINTKEEPNIEIEDYDWLNEGKEE